VIDSKSHTHRVDEGGGGATLGPRLLFPKIPLEPKKKLSEALPIISAQKNEFVSNSDSNELSIAAAIR
jgi:hypothetical protein